MSDKTYSIGLYGAEGGYNTAGDILTTTADGMDLNKLWTEFQTAVQAMNESRSLIVSLLTFTVTENIERVQQISSTDFEEASEFGEPRGARPKGAYQNLGYDFKWYDLAARFTWKFLADAPASQVEAINAMALEADNRMVFTKVMKALYRNVNRSAEIDGLEVPVYPLYNGDGTVPPAYKTNTFDGTHNHYLASGAATVDSGDLDDMYEHLRHHGYSMENGVAYILLVNSAQAKKIRTFKVATGATWDFIPSTGQPAQLLDRDVVLFGGTQPPATYGGLSVAGRYGPMLVLEDDMFPVGYMVLIGSGGPENLANPVGIREHKNESLRGLRLVKGPNPDYPLIDSFYQRGFGTGVRQRGGAVVMQITTNPTYAPPTAYASA